VKSSLVAFPYLMLDPVALIDEDEKWLKHWNELVSRNKPPEKRKLRRSGAESVIAKARTPLSSVQLAAA